MDEFCLVIPFKTCFASLKGNFLRVQSDVSWTVIISVSWASFWWIFYVPTPTSVYSKHCSFNQVYGNHWSFSNDKHWFKENTHIMRAIIKSSWWNWRQCNSIAVFIHINEWSMRMLDDAFHILSAIKSHFHFSRHDFSSLYMKYEWESSDFDRF